MFVTRRHLEDVKAAHAREVAILVSWIEQLQLQVGTLNSPRAPEPVRPGADPEMAMFMSDDEQDLRDAHEMNLIDETQLQAGLEQLGFANHEVVAS